MKFAPLPSNEEQRLDALYEYKILDTPHEESFDRVIRLICRIFSAPLATIALVDRDRQWFKSSCGVDACETDRDISFCGHVIYQGSPLIVPDTYEDPRFADNPLVLGPPYVRFYAGVPLTTHEGLHIGVLCVQDVEPWPQGFSEHDLTTLSEIAAMTIDELELRKAKSQVEAEQDVARRVINYATRNEVLYSNGIRHYYRPAELLSGDLLLAARSPADDAFLFLIGDFTGHGIGAAVGVPALAGKFYELIEQKIASKYILSNLNQHLYRYLPPERFLTAALIEIGLWNGEPHLTIWNAGLPALLMLAEQREITRFPSEGLPLGIVPSPNHTSEGLRYPLPSLSSAEPRLYAYSDGVIESRLDDDSLLGIERLQELLYEKPITMGFDRVIQLLEEARQRNPREADDVTLLELDINQVSAMLNQSIPQEVQ